MVHSFGLGYILYCQSVDGDFVRSYLERGCTIQEAFDNWKKYTRSLSLSLVHAAIEIDLMPSMLHRVESTTFP